MALSFEESKKQALKQMAKPMLMAASINVENSISVAENFERSNKYEWYNEYSDEIVSTIDNLKNIAVDSSQINLTQEENSQYIPFEMERYYDGVDLMKMTLQIHYVNANKDEEYCAPINVQYSYDKIRFGWLVPSGATVTAGELTFEIIAHGTNEKGNSYLWRTRPNGKLNVLKSLVGNGVVKPSNDWYIQFVTEMDKKVNEANKSADRAEAAANKIEGNIEEQVNQQLEASINDKLTNYYNKSEVDNKIANVKVDLTGYATEDYVDNKVATLDVSGQLVDYAKKTENGYILNFFADSVDDIAEVSNGKEFVTKNGTNYGAPLASSTVVITLPDKTKKTYVLNNDGEWSDQQVNLDDYYTKEEADEKFSTIQTVNEIEQDITDLQNKPIYKHSVFVHKNTSEVYSKDEWIDFTFYSNLNTPVKKRDLCPQGSEGSFLLLAQTFGHHHISDMENNDAGYIISIHSFDQGSIKCVKYDGTIERFLITMDDACTVSDAVYRMDRYSIN